MDDLPDTVRDRILSMTASGRQASREIRALMPPPSGPSETNQSILRALHWFLAGLPAFIDINSCYLTTETPVARVDLAFLTQEFNKIAMRPAGRYAPFYHMSVTVRCKSIQKCKEVYKKACRLKDRLLDTMELSSPQQPTKLVVRNECTWPQQVDGHFITNRGISLSLSVYIYNNTSRVCQVHCTFKNIRDRH